MKVEIVDETGEVIKTIQLESLGAGEHALEWDGTNDDGDPALDGVYTVRIDATNSSGESVSVDMEVVGKITGVSFEDGATYLIVNGSKIPLGSIVEVLETPSETDQSDEEVA